MSSVTEFASAVRKELEELVRIGVDVPPAAFNATESMSEMEQYVDMSVTDCADMLLTLANGKDYYNGF